MLDIPLSTEQKQNVPLCVTKQQTIFYVENNLKWEYHSFGFYLPTFYSNVGQDISSFSFLSVCQ